MPNTLIDYRISLNESNVLKGIAICAMLVHHLFLEYRDYSETAFRVALICKACVAVFVFLSGYGLATQFENKFCSVPSVKGVAFLKFLAKRLLKFYLNYWVVFFLSVLLGVLFFGRTLSIAYGTDANVVLHLFKDFWGLHGVTSYNATWWFNELIIYLYLWFPLLFLAGRGLVGVCMLILLYCWPTEIFSWVNKFYAPLSTYMVIFFLGIFLARNKEYANKILNHLNSWVVVALSGALFCLLCICRNKVLIPGFFGVTVDPFLSMFLALFVVSLCRMFDLKMKFLAFVGKHSMNMYLLHTFVGTYFFSNFIYSFKYPLVIFAVQFGINLALSVTLEFLKEKAKFYNLQTFLLGKIRF